MSLDDTQRSKVAGWIAEGLKLSEIQSRLGSEFGVNLTYMAVRLLVDDLKLTPKEPEPPPAASPTLAGPGSTRGPGPAPEPDTALPASPMSPGAKVAVSVDKLARPGALVSGKVTFSD